MAYKTFISYKYDEARDLRDKIIEALGDDATYYKGETSKSPDLTDTSTDNIKCHLSNMIYDTSVTIVILSPNITQSKWIEWEITYSLKSITRKDRTSHPNGVVGVIMKYNDGYDWIRESHYHSDGCKSVTYIESKILDIINFNKFNKIPMEYVCEECGIIDDLIGSYISYVEEDEFLNNPHKYIINAYKKSENDASGYRLKRSIK